MDEILMQALSQFEIENNLPVEQTAQKSSWVVGGKYILKSFLSDCETAKRVACLNDLLYRANAPAAKHYKSKTGNFYALSHGGYFTLAEKLPGAHGGIYEGDSQKRAYSLGKNLAKLHLALKTLDGKAHAYDMDTMDELRGWILKEVNDKNIAVQRDVIDYCLEFDALYHRLPRQIIHRDPHKGNMLFLNDEITGFIDFDISQVNIRVFDMCYAFSPPEDKFDKWLSLRPYFFSGYYKISEISKDEMAGFAYMCILLELLCAAFWSALDRKDKMDETLRGLHWLYGVRDKIAFNENELLI